ncbi:MAG: DUF3788 domain-containing protein [Firmicutes bacterium]|nr:DUF3788 domain-containing protein [Bacillota bacterium]MCL2256520.1 DUF3788 domain-containing protein [Bacillota bacterium]
MIKKREVKPYIEVKAKLGFSSDAWERLTGHVRNYYELDELWQGGNPNHKHHSNLYFKKNGKTILTLCLREGFFIVYVVFGKEERERFEATRGMFEGVIYNKYDNAEIYHDGKWLAFDVKKDEKSESLIDDIFQLIQIKLKPNRTIVSKSTMSGQLDLGLSKQEITNILN